jgi:hypothetical protein
VDRACPFLCCVPHRSPRGPRAAPLFAASDTNLAWHLGHLSSKRIGHDKINQLRHVRFFVDAVGVHTHMRKHQ